MITGSTTSCRCNREHVPAEAAAEQIRLCHIALAKYEFSEENYSLVDTNRNELSKREQVRRFKKKKIQTICSIFEHHRNQWTAVCVRLELCIFTHLVWLLTKLFICAEKEERNLLHCTYLINQIICLLLHCSNQIPACSFTQSQTTEDSQSSHNLIERSFLHSAGAARRMSNRQTERKQTDTDRWRSSLVGKKKE